MTNTPDLIAALDRAVADARTHYGPTPTPEPVATMWALADYDRLALLSVASGRVTHWSERTAWHHRTLTLRAWVTWSPEDESVTITDAGRAATGRPS